MVQLIYWILSKPWEVQNVMHPILEEYSQYLQNGGDKAAPGAPCLAAMALLKATAPHSPSSPDTPCSSAYHPQCSADCALRPP